LRRAALAALLRARWLQPR